MRTHNPSVPGSSPACPIFYSQQLTSSLAPPFFFFVWLKTPVWIYGDVSAGNLLVQEGQLCGIIDFGQLGIGDPACDLAITWTLFKDENRKLFRSMLPLDANTWARGRAWILWKALIYIVDDLTNMNFEAAQSWCIIDEVLLDHKSKT